MPTRPWIAPLALLLLGCAPRDRDAGQDPAAAAPAATDTPAAAGAPAATDTPAAMTAAAVGHDAADAGPDAATLEILATRVEAPPDDAGAAAPPPCPGDDAMALVGSTCVDRYEAHLVFEAGAVFAVHPHYQRPEPGVRYLARSAPGVYPQGYISRVEAKAACEAAGKRLCTRGEWQRACKNKGVHRYPYGPEGERKRCNTGKLHLLRELYGENPRGGWKYDEHFNNPELAQKPGFLAKTGEHPGCVSDLEVYDMVGNLHEWVSDMVDQDLMDKLAEDEVERREQPWQEGNGIFMGGFFSTTSELGPGCYYITVAHEPKYHDYSTGFRCCAAARLPPAEPVKPKAKPKPKPQKEKETVTVTERPPG